MVDPASAGELLLPEGTCLIHVGPYKTGTTAIQASMHANRDEISAQGALYAGRRHHEIEAIRWLTGRTLKHHPPRRGKRRWEALIEQIHAAADRRVLFSSEHLCQAVGGTIEQVIDEVGRDRAHVLVTVRPLAKILPSQWQQDIQWGLRASYGAWLEAIFDDEAVDKPRPRRFWLTHRHDTLVKRWADVVGPDKVTVVVHDSSDRSFLPRSFEQLLGLSAGTLTEQNRNNRSLRLAEAEMLRQYNHQFHQNGLPAALNTRLNRAGALLYLIQRTPGPVEQPITTPAWALRSAAKVDVEMAGNIDALGVNIIGDLSLLTRQPTAEPVAVPDPVTLVPEIAARWATGLVLASQRIQPIALHPPRQGKPADAVATVAGTPSRDLAKVVRRRVTRRLAGKLRR